MNDGLIDAFGHDAWSTRELVAVCRRMTPAHLDATAAGTYGSVIATLRHIASSEAGYCARLTGDDLRRDRQAEDSRTLDELSAVFDDLATRWARFLADPFDAERTFVVKWPDETDYDVPAGVYVAQALHHGNEHRAQICTILSSIGLTAPGLGVWEYAEATNRVRPSAAAR